MGESPLERNPIRAARGGGWEGASQASTLKRRGMDKDLKGLAQVPVREPLHLLRSPICEP
jgi:hypothetical protein